MNVLSWDTMNSTKEILKDLEQRNITYQSQYQDIIPDFIDGQDPAVAVLTCADSRVIPELIFQKSIGDIFVVRVAGNIAVDPTVISSLEYAVNHLQISHLIILGHTKCGAVKATEETDDKETLLFKEIRESFPLDKKDHIRANILRQLDMLPKRSISVKDAVDNKKLTLLGAIYHVESGSVEFLE